MLLFYTSVDIHLLPCSRESPLGFSSRITAISSCGESGAMVSPRGPRITSCNQQTMLLNFYCQCWTVAYGLSSSRQETSILLPARHTHTRIDKCVQQTLFYFMEKQLYNTQKSACLYS